MSGFPFAPTPEPVSFMLRRKHRIALVGRQSGGVMAQISLAVFGLALLVGAAAVIYLGTAAMPTPSQSVQKPIPDAQIKKR